ncbi:hypothetical protein K439DRAFT_1611285 [Ramaria rubella]|nr:hypothetical protein K439DRAFT_1611285 [Ramaria rubella]
MGNKWSQSAVRKCGVKPKEDINTPDDSPSKSTQGATKKRTMAAMDVDFDEDPSPKQPKTHSQIKLPDIQEVDEEIIMDGSGSDVPLDKSVGNDTFLCLDSDLSELSDLSEPEQVVEKKKKGRPKGMAAAAKAKEGGTKGKKADRERPIEDGDRELVFFVPLGSSKGQGRVPMPMSTSFAVALQMFHKAMECDIFHNKPPLTYTMKGTRRMGVRLIDESDWAGLKAHVRAVCKADLMVNINLQGDADHMEALRAQLGGKAVASTGNKWNGKKASKMIDLDRETAIVPDEEAELRQREREELAILKKKHADCPECGNKVHCKVNKHRVHVALTHQQLAGWASSIVRLIICVV